MTIKFITACAFFACSTAILAGCTKDDPLSMEKVLSTLKAGGVEYSNATPQQRSPSSNVPNSYREHFVLALPSVAPKGGQFFICDQKEYCDAIFNYFDLLKGLAGPYIYRSGNGLVVVQLNSGLKPADAEKVKAALEKI